MVESGADTGCAWVAASMYDYLDYAVGSLAPRNYPEGWSTVMVGIAGVCKHSIESLPESAGYLDVPEAVGTCA